MKRFSRIFALVLALVMTASVFAACGGDEADTTAAGTNAATADENKVHVTWYYGSEILKEEDVEKGSKLTEWTPVKEGKTFTGWCAEASATTPFDFTKEITADTDIFAAFRSDVYVEDKTEYYLIGTGSGSMNVSGWDHNNSYANLKMVKDTTITDKNVYTIEITMYAGDRFQICHDLSWDGQFGIGGVVGAAYAAGINPNKPDEGEKTVEDEKYAEVKDKDGNVVFIGGDENNNSFTSWNIILNEGHDGKYKFTLTTNPSSPAYNTIEWELVEKVDALTQTHDMHLIGSFNGWDAASTDFAMNESEDKATWSGFLTLDADAEIKVINHVDGLYYGTTDGANIALTAGTYCVKYTVADNSVVFQPLAYYVVGTFKDAEGKAVNFAVKDGVTPALTVADGKATADFTAVDVTAMNDYNWITAQGKPGVMAVKIVFGCELGIKDWYADPATEGDNFYLPAGEYTATFDIAAGTASVTQK